ncbi:MAG: PEP-utilizing enzyme, partial [bacterium]
VRENPQRLIDVIDGNDRTYLEIDRIGEAMAEAIECDDLSEARENGLRLLDLYEQAGAQFIIAFSLGKELTAAEPTDGAGREALQRHDDWRNSMALKEEKLECGLLRLIEALLRADGLTADPADLMLKLTVDELRNWLDGKTSGPAVAELAEGRDLHRLAFVDLDELQQAVIADPETVRQLTERFSGLAGRTEPNRPGELTGQVAFDPGKPVTGPAIVIRTRDELAEKGPQATGRIVVAEQTTPHYLPYLRGVLGIVTDEGGLTCHAAIVAREMRLPCIVGTGTATRDIADDDMIELRPNQKTVLINPTTDRQD